MEMDKFSNIAISTKNQFRVLLDSYFSHIIQYSMKFDFVFFLISYNGCFTLFSEYIEFFYTFKFENILPKINLFNKNYVTISEF